MDGYELIAPNTIDNMRRLCDNQIRINDELECIAKEIEIMPGMPRNIEKWLNSISLKNDRFKLSDFSRIFQISKKYNSLVEEKSKNISSLKIIIIENILDQIKSTIDEK